MSIQPRNTLLASLFIAAGAAAVVFSPVGFAQPPRSPGPQAPAPAPSAPAASAPAAMRVGMVDMYAIVEKLMARPEYKKAQEDLSTKWKPKLEAIQKDFAKLQADLQVLPQSDPKFQDVYRSAREKQNEYDHADQDRQRESEALSAHQLTEAYSQVREAASKAADRLGYTHIVVSRPPARPINTDTVGATLQEFLARPLIKIPDGDDLTGAVAADLKVDL